MCCLCYATACVPVIQFRTCIQKEILVLEISFFNFQFGTTKKAHFSKLQYLALSENEVPVQCLRKYRSLKQTAVLKNFAIFQIA